MAAGLRGSLDSERSWAWPVTLQVTLQVTLPANASHITNTLTGCLIPT